MRVIMISFFCLLISQIRVSAQINLCDTVTVLKYEPIPVAVSPGHFIDGFEIEVNEIKYHVTINKKKRIEFVNTTDSSFRLGTIAIGTPYNSIPKKMIQNERPNYGWGYEVNLKNGWTAVFDDPLVFKSLNAYRKSRIGWFYKSTDCKIYSNVLE